MLNFKNEEITGLKQHIQKFNTENISLKRLVTVLEAAAKEDDDLKA
jgi:hypothetical protein